MTHIKPETLSFLSELQQNNNRKWFNAHKNRYLVARENVVAFTEALHAALQKSDLLEPTTGKQALYRIYRDIRFSKDKTPYKTGFMGHFRRATALRRGGYYFRISPNNASAVMGAFWQPNSADIKRIRQEIAADPQAFHDILNAPSFKRNFGQVKGEQLKTAPRGFTLDHPEIALLRMKQFLLNRTFTDAQVTSPRFLQSAVVTFQAMRPFLDHMSIILTTDENSVPLHGD